MIFGVMKKISSSVSVETERSLNRLPSHGISPRNRRLRSADGVGRLDDAADHDRAAIGHQHLGGSLLRGQL